MQFAQAVRRKGKSLKECIGNILKWSFKVRYKVDKDIIRAAEIEKYVKSVEMGIPGMGRAKKLIRAYYLESEEGTR